jgi:hypothetical protein
LRAAGIPNIGGFHVTGMLAMFDKIGPDLQAALDMGITLFAGEAEGRIDEVFARCRPRRAQANLQLHQRPTCARTCGNSIFAGQSSADHGADGIGSQRALAAIRSVASP